MTSAANAPQTAPLVPQVRATAYTVTMFREPTIDSHVFDITVEETAPGRWAVRRGSRCLSVLDTWEHESIPSDRDDDWLAAHRFDLHLALETAQRVAPDVVVNGYRAADAATTADADRRCGETVPELEDQTGERRFRCSLAANHLGVHHDFERGHKWAEMQVRWS